MAWFQIRKQMELTTNQKPFEQCMYYVMKEWNGKVSIQLKKKCNEHT
jgi:hypothetical protein